MASWFRAAEELFEVVDRRAKQVVSERLREDLAASPNADSGLLGRMPVPGPQAQGKVGHIVSGKASTSKLGSQTTVALASGNQLDVQRRKFNTLTSNGSFDGTEVSVSASDVNESVDSNAANNQLFHTFESENLEHLQRFDDRTSGFEGISPAEDLTSMNLHLNIENNDKTPTSGDALHKTLNESGGNIKDAVLNSYTETTATCITVPDVNGHTSLDMQDIQVLDSEPVKCQIAAENGVVTVTLSTDTSKTRGITDLKGAEGTMEENLQVSKKMLNGMEENLQVSKKMLNGYLDLSAMSVPLGQAGEPGQQVGLQVEEQLDEAQGLLKNAVSSGQSKEARLARVCAGLSLRLQEYKAENVQLEELVFQEREAKTALEMKIKELHSEIVSAKTEASAVEIEMAAALASKNTEIETLLSSMETIKKQAAVSEGKLASLQANVEALARSRDMTETGMIQTLREELASAERRAEEERTAHNSTRKAAVQRETELEQCVAEATAALTKMQRTVDERTLKATELEQKLSMLEVDCATLNQELQEMEARLRREQKRPPEEVTQTLQAWQEEAERARQAQREAERKLSTMETETQKLRVELAGVKRNADQYSTQAHMELEKRFRELTELLYLKQTQLEAMASEKAAAIIHLEKESKRFKEAQEEAERHKNLRRSAFNWDEENDLKPLESLGLQRRLVGPSIQRAAKLLDSGAVTAGRFLWRRPLARLIVLFYLVFVHFFLMYLLHRLQEQADSVMSSKEEIEAAAAAGLVKLGSQI